MMDAVETALVARGVPAQRVLSEHFSYSFSGRSPLARRMRQAWWLLSAASLLGLVLILAQERLWRLFGSTA
jgi:ferredoxin-NADP reductase